MTTYNNLKHKDIESLKVKKNTYNLKGKRKIV